MRSSSTGAPSRTLSASPEIQTILTCLPGGTSIGRPRAVVLWASGTRLTSSNRGLRGDLRQHARVRVGEGHGVGARPRRQRGRQASPHKGERGLERDPITHRLASYGLGTLHAQCGSAMARKRGTSDELAAPHSARTGGEEVWSQHHPCTRSMGGSGCLLVEEVYPGASQLRHLSLPPSRQIQPTEQAVCRTPQRTYYPSSSGGTASEGTLVSGIAVKPRPHDPAGVSAGCWGLCVSRRRGSRRW
jgi:hypothetical protein